MQNHPIVDANKRTGTVAADVFLKLNGSELIAPNDDLFALVLSVAQGGADKAAVAQFFRANVRTIA